jgi:hypothetical protein
MFRTSLPRSPCPGKCTCRTTRPAMQGGLLRFCFFFVTTHDSEGSSVSGVRGQKHGRGLDCGGSSSRARGAVAFLPLFCHDSLPARAIMENTGGETCRLILLVGEDSWLRLQVGGNHGCCG